MPRPGTLGLPHHTNTLLPLLALGISPPHLSQSADTEIDVLRRPNAVVCKEQAGKENTIADLEGIVLEESSAEVLFDDGDDGANEVVAL